LKVKLHLEIALKFQMKLKSFELNLVHNLFK